MNLLSLILVFLFSFNSGTALYSADGKASYYADRMHGHRTANGERYDKTQLTAAHATLPFNTYVQVTNVRNGKSVIVRINDRMAHSRHRIIDLSKAAAQQIELIREGIASVQLHEVPDDGQPEMTTVVSEIKPTGKK
ncbi:septal ring lytic transglycosylase RlpA family protein [Pontibacter sp. FD36]|uniref:Probable endolytic peptidoglycan transglycosylase RlpA n=2 Tax=Pontibacter TaxID=323449 RepID=A0A1N6X8R6_9BACT|nr:MULTISPECIES: septal ring lytic transglycosylase RlpA family protein [Pontibacter]MBF8963942.1 septal ring lytic transglycosylase RlpA family protein [Pontibacter sp. FD36]SIQ98693.1 rare lipoprotein A [Pontibacter lucknowensis]